MRLSYIWIQNFKGFHNEGFNFSSQYVYSYNPDEKILMRNDNVKYISNFFGEDILEVTGVIGKNATGKTNLLELIQYVMVGANTLINSSFLCVVEDLRTSSVFKFKLDSIKNNFGANIITYKDRIDGFDSIFFSNVFDGRNYNFSKKVLNLSTNSLLQTQFGENVNRNYQNNIKEQIRFFESKEINLLKKIFSKDSVDEEEDITQITPDQVMLTSPIWSNIRRRFTSLQRRLENRRGISIRLDDFIRDYRQKITKSKSRRIFIHYTAFLVFVDVLLNRGIHEFKETKIFTDREQLNIRLQELLSPLESLSSLEELFDYWTGDFASEIDIFFELKRTSNFLNELKDNAYWLESEENRQDLGKYSNRKIQFTYEYDKKFGNFLNNYLDAVTNDNLVYSIDWLGMSSGHKAYVNLFSKFYSIKDFLDNTNALVTIDEGDLYFHPQWQREFLYSIVNVLPEILDCKLQLILTTHSPFLISDLPKNNLIFLERDGIFLNVLPNNQIEGETFGGNIGELYLDAFFMQGKLISQFAEIKIQDLIDKINDKIELSDQDFTLLESIGDEFIKIHINNLRNDPN